MLHCIGNGAHTLLKRCVSVHEFPCQENSSAVCLLPLAQCLLAYCEYMFAYMFASTHAARSGSQHAANGFCQNSVSKQPALSEYSEMLLVAMVLIDLNARDRLSEVSLTESSCLRVCAAAVVARAAQL